MKNTLEEISSRVDETEDQISDLKDEVGIKQQYREKKPPTK